MALISSYGGKITIPHRFVVRLVRLVRDTLPLNPISRRRRDFPEGIPTGHEGKGVRLLPTIRRN